MRLECLAEELRAYIRADGFGEAKVLEPFLDGPGDSERGGSGQVVYPWVA